MNFEKASCIYFSPTGTTKKIVETVSQNIGVNNIAMIDVTSPDGRDIKPLRFENELVIVAVPVYYGRLPEIIVPFLNEITGNNTAVIPLIVYGNRDYDDALIELYDILISRKFVPLASGAFIGEHSYSIPGREIAHDRPDDEDITRAAEFGSLVRKKIEKMDLPDSSGNIAVPGNHPYKEPTNLNMIKKLRKESPMTFTPETDMTLCNNCLKCVDACPVAAIHEEDVATVDKFKCIICFACVKICPMGAKGMSDPNFNNAIEQLKEACGHRKEPEFFF